MRKLCDGEWSGGRGLLPSQVGDLTPNQFWFLWAPAEWFKETDGRVVQSTGVEQAIGLMDPDGTVAARAGDGTPIKLRISASGLSKAGQLAAAKRKANREAKQKQGRRRRGT